MDTVGQLTNTLQNRKKNKIQDKLKQTGWEEKVGFFLVQTHITPSHSRRSGLGGWGEPQTSAFVFMSGVQTQGTSLTLPSLEELEQKWGEPY